QEHHVAVAGGGQRLEGLVDGRLEVDVHEVQLRVLAGAADGEERDPARVQAVDPRVVELHLDQQHRVRVTAPDEVAELLGRALGGDRPHGEQVAALGGPVVRAADDLEHRLPGGDVELRQVEGEDPGAAAGQAPGDRVRAVPERVHRLLDPLAGRGRDRLVAGEHVGD